MNGARPLSRQEAIKARHRFGGKMATRNLALFTVGSNTGFRVSELLSLKLGDVMEKNGHVKDRITVSRLNMKGKKISRTILLNDYACKCISRWLQELKKMNIMHKDDYLFQSKQGGNAAIGRTQAWKILNQVFLDSGFNGKLGTHAMRKTFANNIYKFYLERVAAGEALDAFRLTSKALGHMDIRSTDKYLSFLTEDIDRAVRAIGF